MNPAKTIASSVTRYGTHNLIDQQCPSCGAVPLRGFYAVRNVPVNSVILLKTREEALNYPLGDIHLAYCWNCGFVTNVSFDPNLSEYSDRYEETQGYSATFNEFHRRLAEYLIEEYKLRSKRILEIGCGKGEFLALLCEMGGNEGIGFDPAFVPERTPKILNGSVKYYPSRFTEEHVHMEADFYVCKMTLEHIYNTRDFVTMVRRAVGDRVEATVFFQIPEVFRILRELAFWDIYYEHPSYFSAGSLGRLFRKSGFDVIDIWTDFDNQYLMIEASPGVSGPLVPPLPQEDDLKDLYPLAGYFSQAVKTKARNWLNRLKEYSQEGKRVVLWGGSSKAVAFLTSLNIRKEVEFVVDINPQKAGTFIAGSGQEIVPPEFLIDYQPDVIVVMNPVYIAEIRISLGDLGLSPLLVPVNA